MDKNDYWAEAILRELRSLTTKEEESDKWKQVKNLTGFLTGTGPTNVFRKFTQAFNSGGDYILGGFLKEDLAKGESLDFEITSQNNQLQVDCKMVKVLPMAIKGGMTPVDLKEPASVTVNISMAFDLEDIEMQPQANANFSVNFPIENFVLPANDGNQ